MKIPVYLIGKREKALYKSTCLFSLIATLFSSCISNSEPFNLLEFSGSGNIVNYSKSYLNVQNISDSINPTVIAGSRGDLLLLSDDQIFIYEDSSSKNRFTVKYLNNLLYINDKIQTINIPKNDEMIPWFKNLKDKNLSSLQFIKFNSEIISDYLPYLGALAEIKPDAGLYFDGDFRNLLAILDKFNPRYLIGPEISQDNFDRLNGLTNLEIMSMVLAESGSTMPLPSIPTLKQVFISGRNEDLFLTKDFFSNNRQICKVTIDNIWRFDLALLNPLDHLKELVINSPDTLLNLELLNNHKELEVLSITGSDLVYDPGLIKLPSIRWIAFSKNVSQKEFDLFIGTHPDLEIIEFISNDTIGSLLPLQKLNKLKGLTVTDSVADFNTIKTLKNLKYLSLPSGFLKDSVKKAEIQRYLPGVRVAANEGFCLGSAWLLLLVPLVFILRLFPINGKREKKA